VKIVIIAIFIIFSLSFGNNLNKVSGFDFVNLPVSARSAGGAISLLGEKDNILSLRTNPAMLAGINKPAVSIDFAPVIMDIYYGASSLSFLLENDFVLVPSISYVSFGQVEPRNENGDVIESYISPFSACLETALARKFYEKLNVGVRLKFIYEQVSQKMILWDKNYAVGIGADVGIFSQHKSFRYSAGFRNVGFSFDNYESVDVKLPTSAFVGIGVIIESESKLNWFLECEKYFYDYMYFRTGFEFPVYRDVLILRTGTIFSPNDVKYALNAFGVGEKKIRTWEYSGENWLLASVGATINAKIEKKLFSLDIACQFRKDGLAPGFLFSGTMYF